MHFGFALELSDIDLWNTHFLDTHLDLLSPDKYTDIPSKYFVCLHKIVFKICLQDVFKTCVQDIFKTCVQDVFKTCLQDVFKTCLQRNNFSSSKASSRCLWRRKIVTLKTCWRRRQDQEMFAGEFFLKMSNFHWFIWIKHQHALKYF